MRWQGRRGSRNIEDRRGRSGVAMGGMGGVGLLAVLAIGYFLGIDVTPLLEGTLSQGGATAPVEADRRRGDFVSVVLADSEDVWGDVFERQLGRSYRPVTLVLYAGGAQSPCGLASGATGPFYCPGDRTVYLDTGFFATLERQLGAGGDFAAAYVVAHEVGHHVQDELGILGPVNQRRARADAATSNALSVRVELQADCFAGIFARFEEGKGYIEGGDIAEAMNAAARIGDDTLQKNAGRRPMPDSFTHGTSRQRQDWFARGYESGEVADCDTFPADRP